MLRSICTAVLLIICLSPLATAQNEISRERSSLLGISEFGIVINIEKPVTLNDPALNTADIRQAVLDEISDLPVSILDDRRLRDSDQYPILHIHINIMRATNNTYPFAIESNFYQPVKLILNRDLQTMASTWNKGEVGIVSGDMFHIVVQQAVGVSALFGDEYRTVN